MRSGRSGKITSAGTNAQRGRMATRSGTLARIRLRAAAIVEEAGRHAGRLAGGAPRRAPAPDGDAVVVEYEQAIGVAVVAACPPSRQGFGHGV